MKKGSKEVPFLSDAELIKMLSQSEKDAFDTIYNKYWESLFLYVVKVVKDEDAACDIVQDVFVTLWSRRVVLEISGSLKSYLFTAVRYRAYTYIQQELSRDKYRALLLSQPDIRDNSLLERLQARDMEEIIEDQLQKLPPKMKEIFQLSRKEYLSHKEIALKLNISDQTVKKQIAKAIKQFRLRLRSFLIFLF